MSATIEPEKKPAIHQTSFAEEALKMGGKSADEVRRMGALDSADDRVEDLFAERYQTVNSPIHRAVWEKQTPIDLFHHSETVVAEPNATTA